VDIWYDVISMFYRLQNLLTRYATSPRWREQTVRTLQGNPYIPETQERAKQLLAAMQESYQEVLSRPGSLLRPWAMDPERDGTLTCPECLGVAVFQASDGAFTCRRCGATTPAPAGYRPSSLSREAVEATRSEA
jgi:ribosomal protein L37AE/L43A